MSARYITRLSTDLRCLGRPWDHILATAIDRRDVLMMLDATVADKRYIIDLTSAAFAEMRASEGTF